LQQGFWQLVPHCFTGATWLVLQHPDLLPHDDEDEHDFIQHTALITPHVKTPTKINFKAISSLSLQLISHFILI
tara:strand:- start:6 stop:227 length:222 start_codon:yes stop_codon:yes gene_type:complete